MTGYAGDFKDSFPFFASPTDDPAFYNGGLGLPYYHQALHWPMVVSPYLTGQHYCETQFCPGSEALRDLFHSGVSPVDMGYAPSYFIPSDYWMSYALLSDPKRWRVGADTSDKSLRHSVRHSDVATPSQKGMLIEVRARHLPGVQVGAAASISIFQPEGHDKAYTTALCDGHVRQVRWGDFLLGFNQPTPAVPVLTTANGYLGQDLVR